MTNKPTYEELEMKLRKSEEKLSGVIDSIADHMSMMDRQHNILWTNEVANKLFGPNLVGKKCYASYHGYDKPCEPCIVSRCFEDGKVHEHETKVIGADGEHMNYWCIASIAERHEDGRPKTVVEISRNITEIKKINVESRESEERFRSTFEQAAIGIAHVSPEGHFLRINQRFCDITGYTKEEMLKLTFQDITHPDDLDIDLKYMQQMLSIEIQTYSMEKRYFKKNGSIVWVNLTVSLVRKPSGEPKYFISAVENINKQKQAEQALKDAHDKLEYRVKERTQDLIKLTQQLRQEIADRKQAEEALSISEERYRSLFKNNHSVMLLIDPKSGDIVDANPAAVSFYGWSYEELIYKKITNINMLTEEQVFQEMKKAKNEKRQNFYFRHRLRSGEIRDVEVYSGSIKVYGRELLYSIIHDITKRKQAELSLIERRKELENKSHELEEVNAALKVLLKNRDEDKKDFENKVVANVKKIVFPYVDKLYNSQLNDRQMVYLNIIKSNLVDIIAPFLHQLSSKYSDLTPSEIQVAGLVKDGKTTKEIAELLNSSTDAIDFHRNNLRKKLGLQNTKTNLRSFLLSFT
jgi:PAS domain S-box-containing protein